MTLILGVSASYTAGYLADKFSATRPYVKPIIGGVGSLLTFPLVLVAFTLSHNFWLSLVAVTISAFPGEMWLGPTYAMVQGLFPAQIVGTATAVLSFAGGISGAISNILLGALGDAFGTDEDGRVAGYLLTA